MKIFSDNNFVGEKDYAGKIFLLTNTSSWYKMKRVSAVKKFFLEEIDYEII